MTKVVTPSKNTVTPAQCGKIYDLFVAAMKKSGLPGDSTQQVIEKQGKELAAEFVTAVRHRVDVITNMITRIAEGIDRSLSQKEAIAATGRRFCGSADYAETFPAGTGDAEEITFIPLKKWMSPDAVDTFVEDGGWQYASLHALAKYNQDNPTFANLVPNFIQAKDAKGRHCYVAFNGFRDERDVRVYRYGHGWHDVWFVAVSPASST